MEDQPLGGWTRKPIRKARLNLVKLTCAAHHELLVKGLWDFFKSQRGVDLFLMEWGGRTVVAHQIVADVFLSSEKLVEKADMAGHADLTGQADDLLSIIDQLLEFMYTGTVSVPRERLPGLYDVAKRLDFGVLVDALREAGIREPEKPKEVVVGATPRGRGRPPKNKVPPKDDSSEIKTTIEEGEEGEPVVPVLKRGRGRPRLNKSNNFAPKSTRLLKKKVPVLAKSGKARKLFHRKKWGLPVEVMDAADTVEEAELLRKKVSSSAKSGRARKMFHRKQWGLPVEVMEEEDAADDAGEEAEPVAKPPPKTVVFKCGHCNFTSLVKELAIQHIQTLHIKSEPQASTNSQKHHIPSDVEKEATDEESSQPCEEERFDEKELEDKRIPTEPDLKSESNTDESLDGPTSEPPIAVETPFLKNPLLKCPDCTFHTESEADFRVHLATHDPSVAYFKCHRCDEPFATAEAFEQHEVASHAEAPSLLKCPRCKYRPLKFQTYLEHLRIIHHIDDCGEPIPQPTTCPICEEDCGTPEDLALHIQGHVQKVISETPPVQLCRCTKCDFTCVNVQELKLHKSQHVHKCEHCSFSSTNKGQVHQHNLRVHLQLRRFVCETCGYAAFSRSQLAQHGMTHTGERPFICEVCGRAFTDRSTLRRHVTGHVVDTPRPFACQLCRYSSRRKDALNAHVKLVHGPNSDKRRRQPRDPTAPPLKCRLCAYESDLQADMNRHVREDHGPNINAYACSDCDYTGKSSDVLKRHRRIHTGEKPYVCKECSFAFRDYSTFTRHRRRHCKPNQEKSFVCPVCSQAFVHLRYLKSHLKNDHGVTGTVLEEGSSRLGDEEEGAVVLHQLEEGVELQTEGQEVLEMGDEEDDGSMILQAGEGDLVLEHEESGVIYQTSESGLMLQAHGESGVIYQTDEGEIMLQTDEEANDDLAMDVGMDAEEVTDEQLEEADVYAVAEDEGVGEVGEGVSMPEDQQDEVLEVLEEGEAELEMQVQIITDDTGVALVHVLDGYM